MSLCFHRPPELLVAGKLTPAADLYSFGIILWEAVSRTPPFAGLHHGEVIHKVVTQDLRPGAFFLQGLGVNVCRVKGQGLGRGEERSSTRCSRRTCAQVRSS